MVHSPEKAGKLKEIIPELVDENFIITELSQTRNSGYHKARVGYPVRITIEAEGVTVQLVQCAYNTPISPSKRKLGW